MLAWQSASRPNLTERPSQCNIIQKGRFIHNGMINQPRFPSPVFVLGKGGTLLTLPLLLPAAELPSSALRSRKPVQSSARDSFVAGDSVKYSLDSEGVLGVRWKGDAGRRRELLEVPGRARPACSFCSSVQLRRAAIS